MMIAFFLQKMAIALGGFLAGCYITLAVMEILGIPPEGLMLIVLVCGGLIGILILYMLFDLALVTLSSVAGAALLVQTTMPSPPYDVLIFFGVAIFGLLFQLRMIPKASKPARA